MRAPFRQIRPDPRILSVHTARFDSPPLPRQHRLRIGPQPFPYSATSCRTAYVLLSTLMEGDGLPKRSA